VVRLGISRRTRPHRTMKSRSGKKKSPTSVWRRFMSSTRKTPEPPSRASSSPTEAADAAAAAVVAAAAAAVGVAVVAAAAAAAAGAGAAVAAVCPGAVAASARRERFAATLTDVGRCGRVRFTRRRVARGNLPAAGWWPSNTETQMRRRQRRFDEAPSRSKAYQRKW